MGRPLDPYWPSHACEPTDDKNYEVAERLGVSMVTAYGHIRAFRTRYPQEAPHGVFRGGAAQVERLALWDGEPGRLADAFLASRITDMVDGRLVAHDHAEYVGEAMAKRERAKEQARERAKKYRERKKLKEAGGPVSGSVTQNVTRDVTGSHLLLTHSLSSSSSERGSGGEASGQPKRPKRTMGRGVMGEAEREQAPKTPEELASHLRLAPRFPALDGKRGRPVLMDEVRARWPSFLDKLERHGLDAALAAFPGWLSTDTRYAVHLKAWQAEGNGDVDAAIEQHRATNYRPPIYELQPLDDERDAQ